MTPTCHMLDMVFPLRGGTIARDYADALAAQMCRELPWLGETAGAGVHPIRGTTAIGDELLLGGRAALTLRVPHERRESCAQLQGVRLDLAGPLEIGAPRPRALLAHPTLYSHLVVTGCTDEPAFFDAVRAALAAWQLSCEIIVGRRQQKRLAGQARTGFSVMLHGLAPQASLRAQSAGIGEHRLLGCGLFVPHKSADPAFR